MIYMYNVYVCMCVCVYSMRLYPRILLEIYFHVFSWSLFEPNSNLVKDVPSNNISILFMRSRFKVVTVISSKVEKGKTQVLFFPIYTKRTRLSKSESSNKLIFPMSWLRIREDGPRGASLFS